MGGKFGVALGDLVAVAEQFCHNGRADPEATMSGRRRDILLSERWRWRSRAVHARRSRQIVSAGQRRAQAKAAADR